MMASERHINMAAQLYKMRDAARSLLGSKYEDRMRAIGADMQQAAAVSGKQVLTIALEAAKHPDCSPTATILFMAAAVELVEPSTVMPCET
jgi:hypothetical protein